DIWGSKYPNILQSWLNNWNELATFFKYPKSIQTLIYTTNPIESLNANIKRKTNSKGSFPTIDSAFKMLYMSTQEVQSKWERTSMRNWSEIYPQLCIFFSEIMEKYTK
ncbi:transposase, partial [Aliarcobacter cryaerophilus]|uniref:transposase n=1 Tax=Aliarcobacter cryaerophilus TaxID=28198 RepID=UPI0021B2B076